MPAGAPENAGGMEPSRYSATIRRRCQIAGAVGWLGMPRHRSRIIVRITAREMPELTDIAFSEIINVIRSRTALQAWLAEFLAAFVVFTIARFAVEALLPQPAGAAAGADAASWANWVYAYDQLRSFADDAAVAGLVFAIILEGGLMFLAKKRIRLSRVEGREEGRREAEAAAAARIAELEALLNERRNDSHRESEVVDPAKVAELEARVRELERRSNGNAVA